MPKPSTVRNTLLLALASISLSVFALGDADVEIAVGGQDDAVGAVLDEVLGRDVVGELDARAAVGRALGASWSILEGSRPCGRTRSRRGTTRGAGVDDDRHPVLGARAARPASGATT